MPKPKSTQNKEGVPFTEYIDLCKNYILTLDICISSTTATGHYNDMNLCDSSFSEHLKDLYLLELNKSNFLELYMNK